MGISSLKTCSRKVSALATEQRLSIKDQFKFIGARNTPCWILDESLQSNGNGRMNCSSQNQSGPRGHLIASLRNLLMFSTCPERDSNPQGLLHQILSLARLPIPPSGPRSFTACYVFQRLSDLTMCDGLCDCHAVQRKDTEESHAARFIAVVDSRKRKIRGLVRRGKRFYAQMRIAEGPNGKSRPVRIPLEAASLVDAQNELEKKRTENRKGEMHLPGRRPTFEVLAADYQRSAQFLGKKLGTRENEIQALNRWIAHLGGIRIDWIKADRMTDFRNRRKAEGVSARTINLDLVAFNNAMVYGVERGWLSAAPRLKKLKARTRETDALGSRRYQAAS